MNALAERNRKDVAQRRRDENADALHFRVYGHDEHIAEGCLFASEGGEPCSRDYDATPPPPRMEQTMRTGIVEPAPENWYVGTGIGALYGLPGSDRFAAELAGWNVA